MRPLFFFLLFNIFFTTPILPETKIEVTDLEKFQTEKILEVVVAVLNKYFETLKELDECIEICNIKLLQKGNDMTRIVDINAEIMHYKRCKYLLMRVMVKAHPLCLLGDFECMRDFALDMLEIYEKEFGIS